MVKVPTVTEKNKKSEVLDAYKALLKELEQTKVLSSQEKKQQQEENEIVSQVGNAFL